MGRGGAGGCSEPKAEAAATADELSEHLAAISLGTAAAAAVSSDATAHTAASSSNAAAAAAGSGPAPEAAPRRVAGLEAPLQALRELIGWPVTHAAEAAALGVRWPRGLLLHGPQGCGKTLLVQEVAAEFGATIHPVTASSVFGAYVGESERRLREAFEAAASDATTGRLAVVFLDEVDALAPRREGKRQHEARVVAQLLTLLDGAAGAEAAAAARLQATRGRNSGKPLSADLQSAPAGGSGNGAPVATGRVVVVAATNRPNALDPALRRPGRLDREVSVPVPGPKERAAILRVHTGGLQLAPGVDLDAIAEACHGYSGADLAALAREAAMAAFSTAAAAVAAAAAAADGTAATTSSSDAAAAAAAAAADGLVRPEDFVAAMHRVGPSIVRGQQVELPPVGWDDIGGYADLKRRLRQAVEWPVRHADAFQRLGLAAPRGVLLHGPPGCSKTMLARAAASGSGATFLPLSCAQLYSMYVGEGESTLRDTFARARMAAPSIIFLDEADAMAPGRADGDGGGGAPDVAARLLSTLLTEMDGLEAAPGVLLLAATNRPGSLDAALLRPGRLDVLLYVPPPDEEGRLEALRIHTRSMPLAADVDLPALARGTVGYTGAEVAALCREAALAALREDLEGAQEVAARHFDRALAGVSPALTLEALAEYEKWGKQYSR